MRQRIHLPSTNGVAMRIMEVVYPKCMDIINFSLTIDRVGNHFSTPVLDDFISAFLIAPIKLEEPSIVSSMDFNSNSEMFAVAGITR